MVQKDWGNVLKFNTESEYYETIGFLCKDEELVRVYTESNDKAGAWAAQGRMALRIDNSGCLPRVLKEAFDTSKDGRISETKFVRNLKENHAFTKEIDPTGSNFTKWLYKKSLDDVIKTIPEKYKNDFYRGYHWNCEIINLVRNKISEVNYENESIQAKERSNGYSEGKKSGYYTTKYERSSKNRKEAIKIHGTKCMICGFNFEKVYGELGKDYIEVHHIKPLSSLNEETVIDPSTDLVCVCANCHRMLHRFKNYIISTDELKNIIADNKEGD